MTSNDVRHLFETLQVNPLWYSIGTERDHDVHCLFREADGRWSVSYWERGQVVTRSSFNDETTACEVFVAWVLTSYSTQGALGSRLAELLGPSRGVAPGLYP
jgi:hypothetical protein